MKGMQKLLPILGVILLLAANIVSAVMGHFTILTWVCAGIGLLLFLTVFMRGEAANFPLYARLVLYSALCLGILVVLYLFALNHPMRWDLTKNRNFSLSPESEEFLSTLADEITIYACATAPSSRLNMLMENYRLASNSITTQIVHPARDRLLMMDLQQKLGLPVKEGDIIIENSADEKIRKIDEVAEEAITNAIIGVTHDEEKVVYYLMGHGEVQLEEAKAAEEKDAPDSYSEAKALLEKRSFIVRELELAAQGFIPEDCSLLICAGPANDLLPLEAGLIKAYLEQGGRGLFLLDPPDNLLTRFTNFSSLLADFDIEIKDDIVIDPVGKKETDDMLNTLVAQFRTEHPITKDLSRTVFFLPVTRSVFPVESPSPGATVDIILLSNKTSWSESAEGLLKKAKTGLYPDSVSQVKPQSLAVAYKKPVARYPEKETRLFVIGDSDIFTDLNINHQMLRTLFFNSINWLTQETRMIPIPPKQFDETPLYTTKSTIGLLQILMVVTLPTLIFFGGLGYALLRRKMR